MLISATSFDDIDPDTAPSNHIPNIPHIPEHVPNVPPDPPACHPRQPKPPPPPREPSTRNIKPTDRGNSSWFQKAKPNSVPFPTGKLDVNAEPNADPGGAPPDEDADTQESANIAHGEEPKTHRQAMASPDAAEWAVAENYKPNQLTHLDAYKLTHLPPNHQRTGYRWVYKIKHNSDGDIVLYRARLVAQGFTQCPGEDFFKTFAPVAKIKSICMLNPRLGNPCH